MTAEVRKSVSFVATQGVEDRAVVRKSVAYILTGTAGEAAVRKSVAYILTGLDTSGNLTGGEAVWREGDETNIAPHVDISQPMQIRLTNDYIDTECTLLIMYSDGSFERRFVTPDQSPWTVPVTGEINQLAFFRGKLVPVTIEAIRRGMIGRRFESDNPE